MAKGLESNTSLKTIDLWNNNIRDEGAKALTERLKLINKSLEMIHLS